MDQSTIQTIIEGGMLISLIVIAKSTSDIAGKTVGGGDKPKAPPPDTTTASK